MLVQRILYLRNDLLDIGITHIHTDDDAAFGRIPVDL